MCGHGVLEGLETQSIHSLGLGPDKPVLRGSTAQDSLAGVDVWCDCEQDSLSRINLLIDRTYIQQSRRLTPTYSKGHEDGYVLPCAWSKLANCASELNCA